MSFDKVFLDSDVILDLILDREPFSTYSAQLFSLPQKDSKIKIVTSSLVIANCYYFAKKGNGKKVADIIIAELQKELEILLVGAEAIRFALSSSFNGFEDAIQYFTAKQNKCKVLLSRNLSDYKNSDIPVMTAEQFLKT